MCFHFSRIHSKHGKSTAWPSAIPSLQCDEPTSALSSMTQGHWPCLPSYLSSTRKCCLSCFLCLPETLPYPLPPRLTLPLNSFTALSGKAFQTSLTDDFLLLCLHKSTCLQVQCLHGSTFISFMLIYGYYIYLYDSLMDVWLPHH